jgi:hypothetical protein
MKIFALHYSKLTDKKKYMIEQFNKEDITDFEFIEKYDKEDLTNEDRLLFDESLTDSMISLMKNVLLNYVNI